MDRFSTAAFTICLVLYIGLSCTNAQASWGNVPLLRISSWLNDYKNIFLKTTEQALPQTNIPAEDSSVECFVGGCGGNLCGSERLYGTCEYRPEDVCYGQYSECGQFGANGECAWKPSKQLEHCLESHRQNSS